MCDTHTMYIHTNIYMYILYMYIYTRAYTLYIHVIYIYYYTLQQENGLHKHGTNNPDRIKSYDFKSWDKYDVDREIEKDEDEEEEKNGFTKWKGISPKLTEKG